MAGDLSRRRLELPTELTANAPIYADKALAPVILGVPLLAMFIAGIVSVQWPAALVIVALSIVSLVLGSFNQRIRIGGDGVSIRWLGRERFVPYAEVNDVRASDDSVSLSLTRGGTVRLRLSAVYSKRDSSSDDGLGLPARMPDELADLLRRALDRYRAQPDLQGQARVSRGHRGARQWLEALRGVTRTGSDYREAWLSREMLWGIVQSPAAEPSARAGAAAALRSDLDADERKRLKALAVETVAPRVRVAIEAAASGADDATMTAVLDRVKEHQLR